ncbi:unnamed protein product [Nippostrongylus brasiliensis]|uniref:Transcription factor lin-26 (inferred by orthology to a C. elegans protein) n=1 Tax=Nippostrongylus brasiliensis TaxID=27835 RepID=A0A0N4XXQ6_NIPBR|nr:unnamed protein product [Nippostrongylus brasiliensis]
MLSPELDDVGILDTSGVDLSSGDVNGSTDVDAGADSSDGGLGPSDEQVRASMIHLLNPVLGSAFGSSVIEEGGNSKRKTEEGGSGGAAKKHRWMTVDELEESRFGRSKSYGRVHCKATYRCADCIDFWLGIGPLKRMYFAHLSPDFVTLARTKRTDSMRSEWNTMLHQCFPDYVKAKSRGWQPSHEDETEGVVPAIESPEIKAEE